MGGISVQISVARKHEATQRNTAGSINEGKTWQRLRSEVQHCGKMWTERWIPDLRRTQRCQQRLYDYQAQAKRSLMQVRAVHAKARRALTSLRTCRLGKAGEEKKKQKNSPSPCHSCIKGSSPGLPDHRVRLFPTSTYTPKCPPPPTKPTVNGTVRNWKTCSLTKIHIGTQSNNPVHNCLGRGVGWGWGWWGGGQGDGAAVTFMTHSILPYAPH